MGAGLAKDDPTALWTKVPLFQALPKEEIPKLTEMSQAVSYRQGENIFRQGESGDEFYVIQTGEAEVITDGVFQAKVGPGDYFGEVALLVTEPRCSTIRATDFVSALKITRKDFQESGLHEKIKFTKEDKMSKRHKMMASGAAGVGKDEKKSVGGIEKQRKTMMKLAPEEDKAPPGYCGNNLEALKNILSDRLNMTAFIFVPMGQLVKYLGYHEGTVFWVNFCAIIPLASILGAATEALAHHTGQLIGGLLNATFGNAVEMIMCVQAVKQGLVKVVQSNLLGSILSNLLLVLGMSIFASGMARKSQKFNRHGAASNMTCQLVASISVCLPTCFAAVTSHEAGSVVMISRMCSIFLMGVYCMFLFFLLKTHTELFADEGEEEEEEDAILSPGASICMLGCVTLVVFMCSECLVESIEGVSEAYGLSKAFIGVILLPIVGNAAEHATAVTCGYKGMMDLALGVAVGSSTQIALFVVPVAVMCGWYYDEPMDLDFSVFDTTCQILTVFLVAQVLTHGETNWLHGAMLMVVYIFIATETLFILEPDDTRGVNMQPVEERRLGFW